MGRFKTEVDRTTKRILSERVTKLEQKLRLHDAVLANLVRDQANVRVAAATAAPSPVCNGKVGPEQVLSEAEYLKTGARSAATGPGGSNE